jgi:transposase
VKTKVVTSIARRVTKRTPSKYGYYAHVWTAALVKHRVKCERGIDVSIKTVRRVLKALHFRYKRPRYTLARLSPTWQQSKGG